MMRAVHRLLALAFLPPMAAHAGEPVLTRDPNPPPPPGYRVVCETGPLFGPYGELTATFYAACDPVVRRRERRTVIQTKG